MNEDFLISLVGKLRKASRENRETKRANYDLSARANVNLSIEEIDFLAYLVEQEKGVKSEI